MIKKKKKKDHNNTWHTFQRVLKKTTTFVHIRTIYSYSYIYMHIKHQKTKEVGRCLASLWLKRTVNNVFLGCLGVVC